MAEPNSSTAPSGAALPAMAPGAQQVPGGPALAGAPATLRARLDAFLAQPAMRRALPALVGIGSAALIAALYMAIAEPPRRILFSGLGDLERAQVTEALGAGGVDYAIDPATGIISVPETDYYRASSLVASNGALPAPQGASEMLDSIPLGSSRTLEGERLRLARERELMLTIKEIHGISAVRVHLATPERSVFVRENDAPSASVMVTLASGRSLSGSQVDAIVNLVAGSVPGMTSDAVRVVDQNGRLLSAPRDDEHEALLLQREFEAKLRQQVASLLSPLLGAGNFSSEVQVELEQAEVTSARESYDDTGVVRSESERSATRSDPARVGGVPGVAANTPPPDAQLVDGAPQPTGPGAPAGPQPTDTESAVQRNYELGREVAVTSVRPGALRKLSVAVAVSNEALEAAAPMTAEQLQALVAAAVGADEARGDKVEVVAGAFDSVETPEPQFWQQPWFMPALRYGSALLAVLLVLLFVVRPMMKRARGENAEAKAPEDKASAAGAAGEREGEAKPQDAPGFADLPEQVRLARQLAATRPERAVEALQRMLEPPADGRGGGGGGPARAS